MSGKKQNYRDEYGNVYRVMRIDGSRYIARYMSPQTGSTQHCIGGMPWFSRPEQAQRALDAYAARFDLTAIDSDSETTEENEDD